MKKTWRTTDRSAYPGLVSYVCYGARHGRKDRYRLAISGQRSRFPSSRAVHRFCRLQQLPSRHGLFLERGRRNEGFGGHGSLGDTEEQSIIVGWGLVYLRQTVIFFANLTVFGLFALQEFAIADAGNDHFTQHLTNDNFNVLIVDFDTL